MFQTICKILIIGSLFAQIIFGQREEAIFPQQTISPILKSLILPGLGEFSLDYNKRGKIFFTVESALWLSFISSVIISDISRVDYQSFASENAKINSSNKNRQFWIDIGNYDNREAFQEEHLRLREFNVVKKYENYEWNWDWNGASAKRKHFESLRIRSDTWELIGKFIIGGIIINHFVSAIDVLYLKNRILRDNPVTFIPTYDLSNNSYKYNLYYYF